MADTDKLWGFERLILRLYVSCCDFLCREQCVCSSCAETLREALISQQRNMVFEKKVLKMPKAKVFKCQCCRDAGIDFDRDGCIRKNKKGRGERIKFYPEESFYSSLVS